MVVAISLNSIVTVILATMGTHVNSRSVPRDQQLKTARTFRVVARAHATRLQECARARIQASRIRHAMVRPVLWEQTVRRAQQTEVAMRRLVHACVKAAGQVTIVARKRAPVPMETFATA